MPAPIMVLIGLGIVTYITAKEIEPPSLFSDDDEAAGENLLPFAPPAGQPAPPFDAAAIASVAMIVAAVAYWRTRRR